MATDKQPEQRTEPIFNPDGPNREATEELVEALSTALNSRTAKANPEFRAYVMKTIEAVKEGYEIQSKERYDGFFSE